MGWLQTTPPYVYFSYASNLHPTTPNPQTTTTTTIPMASVLKAMTTKPMPSALTFTLVAKCPTTKARAATLQLPHGTVQTPLYMPVATQASLKGLTAEQLETVGCKLCLNNTYHLGLKPGQKVLDEIGGAHKLQGWERNILTGKF